MTPAPPGSSAGSSAALVEYGVPVPMRDGAVLRADVIRPDVDRPVPVILMRNPYVPIVARMHLDLFEAARAGFAVVAQSVRGTGASDGEFVPWVHEAADGADSVAWCAAQPWSNGRVGMAGASYLGHTQLFAAAARPPALEAIAPTVVPSHPYDLTYEGGVLLLGSTVNWAIGRAFDAAARTGTLPPLLTGGLPDPDALFRTAPLNVLTDALQPFDDWQSWLDHPTHDQWWRDRDVTERPTLPTLFRTGWWDLFLGGTLAEWSRPGRHTGSRLLIGPWSHMNESEAHGEIRYGLDASAAAQDVTGLTLGFLGHHLDGRPLPDGPPVRIYVMGANVWRDEEEWPPPSTQTRMFLQPGGRLASEPPAPDAEPARFVFDPRDPVPTVGGRNLLPGSAGGFQTGPVEQSVLDGRPDILRFTSETLPRDLTVIGHVDASLVVATTAADTDWTVKLVDVHPDGRAFNVCDGIVRAKYRNGGETEEPVTPGTPTRVRIDLAATAFTFQAGHRIRVDVSSSNFPRYDRNPGTGAATATTAESDFVVAEQVVFLDSAHASSIILPVVDA